MKYNRENIRNVYIAADRLVNSGKCTGDDVLALTAPFLDCTEIEGISARFQSDSIGLLFSLTGDGYRVAEKYTVSAEWYRKASGFTAVHGEIYAHMVWKHRIADHYRDALATAKRRKEKQGRRSIVSHISGCIMKWHLIFDREWRDIFFSRTGTIKHLESEITKRA